MVSPEIDYWIKNVCQVRKPVYNRKRYATNWTVVKSALVITNTITFRVNQDDNIKIVLCTDYTVTHTEPFANFFIW